MIIDLSEQNYIIQTELYLLGFFGYKQERLTLANLSKHLTEGKVEEAICGSDGNEHSSGTVTSETVTCPHEQACASSVDRKSVV